MKLFGHIQRRHGKDGLVELSEVSLQASPETLRAIAAFLNQAALDMERGDRFQHRHIQDTREDWHAKEPDRPDIIVVSP